VDEGKMLVRISRRLDENSVGVLLLRVYNILQERPYKWDARTIDGLQDTAIITVVGGRMDNLAEGVQGMFPARVDPREV